MGGGGCTKEVTLKLDPWKVRTQPSEVLVGGRGNSCHVREQHVCKPLKVAETGRQRKVPGAEGQRHE